MSTILFAWELGAGLGHLPRLSPLARTLAGEGHEVYAALRDLTKNAPVPRIEMSLPTTQSTSRLIIPHYSLAPVICS